MNGNVKQKIDLKKAEKLVNLLGFIESQMENLLMKLDEVELSNEVEEISSILNEYSNFQEILLQKLK